MKKTVLVFVILIITCSFYLIADAGSIPEDLLSDDNAKLYIGTVESFTEEQIPSSPYVKVTSATVTPKQVIKGDVQIGKSIVYGTTNIYSKLEQGKQYLLADIDENNISVPFNQLDVHITK